MRVLLLTCNTGEGHNSAAQSIQEALHAHNVQCDSLDFLRLISEKTASFVCGWHTRLYRYAPRAMDAGYSLAEANSRALGHNNALYHYLAQGAGKLYQHLNNGGYDAVVCVHVFAAMMMSQLRVKYHRDITAYFVATDYTCTPPLGETTLDGYFIPHAGLMEEFEASGLSREKLIPSGIPVRRAFYERTTENAKAALGLSADQRNVLLMCGSMGCGPIGQITSRLAEKLPKDTVLSVICGTNEKLRQSLAGQNRKNVTVYGYTDNVPLLMDSAELYLTKPGGISITEATVKRLPMLLIDAVGGCEAPNLSYFTKNDWARTESTPSRIVKTCIELLSHPEKLNEASLRLETDFTGIAAVKIAAHLIEHAYLSSSVKNGMVD